jgi:hypothetical protein
MSPIYGKRLRFRECLGRAIQRVALPCQSFLR